MKEKIIIIGILILNSFLIGIIPDYCYAARPNDQEILCTRDAFVFEGNSTVNFGQSSNLYMGNISDFMIFYTTGWAETYLFFDLSNILLKEALYGIKLRMEGAREGIEVYRVNDDAWNEKTINWINKPEAPDYIGTFEDSVLEIEIPEEEGITFCLRLKEDYTYISSREYSEKNVYLYLYYREMIESYDLSASITIISTIISLALAIVIISIRNKSRGGTDVE